MISNLLEPTKINLSTAATASAIPQQKTSVEKKIDTVTKYDITKDNERISSLSDSSKFDNKSSEDDDNTENKNEIIDVAGITDYNNSIVLQAPDALSLLNKFERKTKSIKDSEVLQANAKKRHTDLTTRSCARVVAPQDKFHNNDTTYSGIVPLKTSSNLPFAHVPKQQLSHCNSGNKRLPASIPLEPLQKKQRKKRTAVEIVDPIPKEKQPVQKQQLLKANVSSSEAKKAIKQSLKTNIILPEVTENNQRRHIINDHSYYTTQRKIEELQKIHQPVPTRTLAHLRQQSNIQLPWCKTQRKVKELQKLDRKVDEQQGISQPVPSTYLTLHLKRPPSFQSTHYTIYRKADEQQEISQPVPFRFAATVKTRKRQKNVSLNLDHPSTTTIPNPLFRSSGNSKKDRVEIYQEDIKKMALELMQTVIENTSNRNLGHQETDTLKTVCNDDVNSPFLPSHSKKKELVSRGVNTDTAQFDVISNRLSEIQPVLGSARSRNSNSNSNNSSAHMSPEEHGEDKVIMRSVKNRPKKPTRNIHVRTETVTRDTEASMDKEGERRRQESRSSSSLRQSLSIDSPYSPTSYSSSSYDKSKLSSPSSEYRKRVEEAEKAARRQYLTELKDRRIIYVGGISTSTTTELLKREFQEFGPITKVSIHLDHDNRYGFVTYANKCDANRAIDEASRNPRLLHLKVHFGGRRYFCENDYQDLDDVHDTTATYHSTVNEIPFESLLKQTQAGICKRNGM